jgi:xanthine/uracil permease
MAERPKDLIYAGDEKPPALPLITIGFQHVAVICPYLVMVALVAEAQSFRNKRRATPWV